MTSQGVTGGEPSRRPPISDGPGWQLFAYSLWVVGCVLFALVALDSRDWRSFAASLLFLFGVLAVMIPLERERRTGRRRSH